MKFRKSVQKYPMKRQEKTSSFLWLCQFFLAIFLLPWQLAAHDITSLKRNIFLASTGDYAVFSKGSQRIFLLVKSISSDSVWIEVTDFPYLSPPERALAKETPWKDLIHTLKANKKVFLIYLSPHNTQVFSFHSKTQTWIPSNQNDTIPFLFTLLRLSLRNAPADVIKTQGKDHSIWSPRVSLDGKRPEKIPTQAKHAFWPPDASLLSGRNILMYFTAPEVSVFPVWISIDTPKGAIIIRAIDIGHDATSSQTYTLPQLTK